jgi:putative transposase
VIALRLNIRWCSDHFELGCCNGEIVRVLFAVDACDREVMAWLATSAGISGEMVRDLMVACVERRFGISKAAHPVEWFVRQRLGLHRQEHARHRNGLGPQALFHASPLAGIQRHRGGIRENLQTRLCSAVDLAGC